MTEPVAPWGEYARSEWARIGDRWSRPAETDLSRIEWLPPVDPLRAPATDEEPWRLEDLDILDGAVVWSAVWLYAVAIVAAALAGVLVALGLGWLVKGGNQ